MLKKFFVYGTLKVGGNFAVHLDEFRKNSVVAKVKGFDLFGIVHNKGCKPAFPAAVKGTGEIVGEIHEYNDEETALMLMDQIEGYNKSNPEDSYYVRNEVIVDLEDATKCTATMYTFNGEIKEYFPKMKEWKI